MTGRITRAKSYKDMAEEIRVLAETAKRDDTKRTLKRVAKQWDSLAEKEARKSRIIYQKAPLH